MKKNPIDYVLDRFKKADPQPEPQPAKKRKARKKKVKQ